MQPEEAVHGLWAHSPKVRDCGMLDTKQAPRGCPSQGAHCGVLDVLLFVKYLLL